MKNIVLRADGNSTIGLGHIYRLLALGGLFKNKHSINFVTSNKDEFITKEILSICDKVSYVPEFKYCFPDKKVTNEEIPFDMGDILTGDEIVITDGYWFGTTYQKEIKKNNSRLICIDDLAQWYFVADAVINHAPNIDANIYKKEPYTKLCLGLDYMILRSAFYAAPSVTRPSDKERCIFLSLGGIDQFGFTTNIVEDLIEKVDVSRILISPNYADDLKKRLYDIRNLNPGKVEIYENADANTIVDILDKSTHAIVSASNVAIEAVARGIKPLIGYYTNNQLLIYHGLIKINKAIGIGNFHDFDRAKLTPYITANFPHETIKTSLAPQNLYKAVAG